MEYDDSTTDTDVNAEKETDSLHGNDSNMIDRDETASDMTNELDKIFCDKNDVTDTGTDNSNQTLHIEDSDIAGNIINDNNSLQANVMMSNNSSNNNNINNNINNNNNSSNNNNNTAESNTDLDEDVFNEVDQQRHQTQVK